MAFYFWKNLFSMNEELNINQANNRNRVYKAFFLYLFVTIIIGIVGYFLMVVAMIPTDSSEDDTIFFILPGAVLFGGFSFILYRFHRNYRGSPDGKRLFISLLIVIIASPFLAFLFFYLSAQVSQNKFEKYSSDVDACEEEKFGSLISVDAITDTRNADEKFITVEISATLQKDLTISLEPFGGVQYQGDNFGTSLFNVHWKNTEPWDESIRLTDKNIEYYERTIPAGKQILQFTLDPEKGSYGMPIKNGVAVVGLKISGPYELQIPARLTSESSYCVYNGEILDNPGYAPLISILDEPYSTKGYSWTEFE